MRKLFENKSSFWDRTKLHYITYAVLPVLVSILYILFHPNIIALVLSVILSALVMFIISLFQQSFKDFKKKSTIQSPTEMSALLKENKDSAIIASLPDVQVKDTSKALRFGTSIFHVNTPLVDLDDFYGRKKEYRMLINRIKNGGSTSIVGEQKSGKTWLLTYTFLKIYSEFKDQEIKAGYIDAAAPKLRTVSGFTNEVLRVLNFSSTFTSPGDLSLAFLDTYIGDLVEEGQTPVLFIDNFEAFTKQEEFNSRFFEALRAMTQIGLALVIASRQSLIKLVSRSTNRSPFFNVFYQMKLSAFDLDEAQEFVRSTALQAGFTEQEQDDMLQYSRDSSGHWPPLRLQLVGNMLLEKKDKENLDYEYDTLKKSKEFEKQIEKEYSMLNA